MAIIKYKDKDGNWKNLIAVEGGESGGILELGTFYREGFSGDVTELITYKPNMYDLFTRAPQPKIITLTSDSSGAANNETFYYDSLLWDYYNLNVEMKFVRSSALGAPEVITLTYFYAEDQKTVTQITASIEEDSRLGDIETALDSIIAMQEALIGGDSE